MIHRAGYQPVGDLTTFQALPTHALSHLDPFLLLNHHGPQHFEPNNAGLPFGPHPHRGFETLTFILSGDIVHEDSFGNRSVIQAGGVQWMTAGKGVIHSEVSSPQFKQTGGDLEVLQLWMNLPARLKLTEPAYYGLQANQIPQIDLDEGQATASLISGTWEEHQGPIPSITGLTMSMITMKAGAQIMKQVDPDHTIFLYIVRGSLEIKGREVKQLHLIEFEFGGTQVTWKATRDAFVLFGHGQPNREPIVAQGPFVMNTAEEINEAYADYVKGNFNTYKPAHSDA